MHKYCIPIAEIVNLNSDLDFSVFFGQKATFFERILCHTILAGTPVLYAE